MIIRKIEAPRRSESSRSIEQMQRHTQPALRAARAAPTVDMRNGVTVVVLVEGPYNNPKHKTLGKCRVGDIITIAGGAYAQYLFDNDLVQPYEGYEMGLGWGDVDADPDSGPDADLDAGTLTATPSGETATHGESSPPDSGAEAADETEGETEGDGETPSDGELDGKGWAMWRQAGLSDTQANAVSGAGLESKEKLIDAYLENGIEVLTDIKGIGSAVACAVLRWAGIDV